MTAPTTRPDRVAEITAAINDRLAAEREWRDAELCHWETEMLAAKEHCIRSGEALRDAVTTLAAEGERMRAERDAIADRASGLVNVMAAPFTEESFRTALTALVSMIAALTPAPPVATSEEGTT
jgi:regulator of protease activity HflC (stomatin/prohibitin superfamily)